MQITNVQASSGLPGSGAHRMPASGRRWRAALPYLLLVALIVLPWILMSTGQGYYVGFVRRVLIVALIATSLSLLVGHAGMVALGHAGFVGVGAYAMAAAVEGGVSSVWLLWAIGAACAGIVALMIGSIAIRTRGVYFIMITLAFSQMLYYFAVSLRVFGGDDGYNLEKFPVPGLGLSLEDDSTFYWVVLALCALLYAGLKRLLEARFGKALFGARDNEARMTALGYPVQRIRLIAFTIAGAVAGLGGALLLTHNQFISPASMSFAESSILLVMVALGGTYRPWGAALGATLWMVLEEVLRQYTEYWHWPMGLALMVIILWAPKGVSSMRLVRTDQAKA